MNKFVTILTVLILTAFRSLAHEETSQSDVKIIAVKSHSVSFKVHEVFVGGIIEVYDANNNLLETAGLANVYAMVRFHEKPSGRYIIKVKKENKETEFGYLHI